MTQLRRWQRDAQAVSPVIGAVLILFIVMVAMGGILLWGVPAIEGLQNQAEFQSVLTQAIQLNAEMRSLRDPQNTKQVTLTMNHGSFQLLDGSRWAISVYAAASYTALEVSGWEDDDATTFTFTGVPAATDIDIDDAVGGQFTDKVSSLACSGTCNVALEGYDIDDATVRIQYKVGATVMAETWIMEAGRVTYRMDDGSTLNRIHLEMGAVMTQQREALFIEDAPTFKPPDFGTDPKDTAYLVRFMDLNGDLSVSGKGRYAFLANLADNYGLSRGRPAIDPAYGVRFQVDDSGASGASAGLLEEGFCNYLLGLDEGTDDNYVQEGSSGSCAGGDVSVLYDPDDVAANNNGEFSFAFIQTEVNLRVTTA